MTLSLPQLEREPARKARPLRLPKRFDPPADWRDRLADLKARHGFSAVLTPPEANAKLAKGGAAAALTLAPADRSGLEVCPARSASCTEACVLWFAGNGYRRSVRDARVARTLALAEDPQAFFAGVVDEAERLARGRDPIRALRLNCASDLPWERVAGFLDALPEALALFDYSKIAARIGDGGQAIGATRPYRLAYSVSERRGSVAAAADIVRRGGSAVVVVAGARRRQADGTYRYAPAPRRVRLAGEWFAAVGGDETDRRDLDPTGCVVTLAGKGSLELPTAGGDRIGEQFATSIDSPDFDLAASVRRAFAR
jgi:hypothetical protein